MKKCGVSKDEVEESYQSFHEQYPSGIIQNEDYINAKTTKVKLKSTIFVLLIPILGFHKSKSSCKSI